MKTIKRNAILLIEAILLLALFAFALLPLLGNNERDEQKPNPLEALSAYARTNGI